LFISFIVVVVNKKSYIASNSDTLVFIHLCNFITKRWIHGRRDSNGEKVSMASYADQCDLAKSTISKIADPPEGYVIPLDILTKICRKEETSLSQLFSDFEKEYNIKY
jgi:DNA-binding Xre family transcriptional regulator